MWRLEKHALDSIRCQYERVLWRVPMGSGLFKLLQVPTPGKWLLVSVTAALFVRSRFRNCPNYPNLHYMITHPSVCRDLELLCNLWLFINQKGKMSNMNANPTCFDPQPAVCPCVTVLPGLSEAQTNVTSTQWRSRVWCCSMMWICKYCDKSPYMSLVNLLNCSYKSNVQNIQSCWFMFKALYLGLCYWYYIFLYSYSNNSWIAIPEVYTTQYKKEEKELK